MTVTLSGIKMIELNPDPVDSGFIDRNISIIFEFRKRFFVKFCLFIVNFQINA